MDKNMITILSPGPNCWKTRKIIASINKFIDKENIEAEIEIISSLKEFVKYRTWILPTIIINNKIVARGYRPSDDKLIRNLK